MPNTPLRSLLYIEDDEGLARLLQRRMERSGKTVSIAISAEDAFEVLKTEQYDLILVDYHLPGMSGLEFIEKFLAEYPPMPVILLTAGGDERLAIKAFELGAADYAVKDTSQVYMDLLPQIMQSAFSKHNLQKIYLKQKQDLEIAKSMAEAANEAKSAFLASISHEIRTPLNVINGLIYALRRKIDEPEIQRILKTIENNAISLRRLIDDLLDLSKIEDKKIELEEANFCFAEVFENLENSFKPQTDDKNIGLIFENNFGHHLFSGDKFRLTQIFNNLISNAIKFTADGHIKISGNYADNGNIIVNVEDTGTGIAAENLDRIFEKFTQADASITRRYGGTGLGLSISRSLAEAMGGNLDVSSELGKGTVFTLNLPIKHQAVDITQIDTTHEPQTETIPAKGKVLIVEDYAPNIMVAEMLLSEFGYTSVAASSGEESVEIIKNSDEPFHAILMDIEMGGINGFEAAKQIREVETNKTYRNVIFGVTAHGLAGDRENCLKAGMDDYIAKPINPETLRFKLGKI